MKKFESKIKNKWIAANVKYLPLLFLFYLIYSLVLVIFTIAYPPEKITIKDWLDNFLNISIIIIPLFAINGIYLLDKFEWVSNSQSKLLAIKSLTVLIAIIIGTVFCEFIDYFLNVAFFNESQSTNISFNEYELSNIEASLIINIFLGMIIGIPILIRQSIKQNMNLQFQKKELEVNNLQKLKVKSQLETLQAKINPHFLYNSLNSIASLAKIDPDKVEQMTIALAKFYRYSTMTFDSNYSQIDKELEMVNTYLEIEKIRFDERLDYSITSNANGDYLIPRFLIQPLVENAIKHGLSKITTQAVLKVNVVEMGNQIEISICDNGPDFPMDLLMGFGLQSTYEKLNLLFPNQYTLQFINGNEKRILIILKKRIKDEPSV